CRNRRRRGRPRSRRARRAIRARHASPRRGDRRVDQPVPARGGCRGNRPVRCRGGHGAWPIHRPAGRHRRGPGVRARREKARRARHQPRCDRLRSLRRGRQRPAPGRDGCASQGGLLVRLPRGRFRGAPGACGRRGRRARARASGRAGWRGAGLCTLRDAGVEPGLGGISRPARRDHVLPWSRVRGARRALPALAGRDALGRPKAGDRMTWQLRRASLVDLDAIMLLETGIFGSDAWSAENMRDELSSTHTFYLVAERLSDSAIVGYAGLLAPAGARDGDVQTIAVAESDRRGGLGRTLIQSLVAEARKRGILQVFLEVRADNGGAQHLYETLGFVAIAERKGYYQPDNVDAIVMKYEIPEPATRPAVGA